MSDEMSVGRIAAMRDEINGMQAQLQLAVQMLLRHEMRLGLLGCPEVRQKPKPGQEGVIQSIPVPDNSPLYRLDPVKVPEKSKIVGNDGASLKK